MATILVVDDDAAIRDSMRVVLEHVNHKVILAENGDEAVQSYLSARPDIVITDLLLPGKSGIEVVREIRRIDPKARVIAMSGESTEAHLSTLNKDLGALELLTKPFRVAQLLALIERGVNTPL